MTPAPRVSVILAGVFVLLTAAFCADPAVADIDTTPPLVTILDEAPYTNTPNAQPVDRTGWNSGIRELGFGATDPESGIWRAEVELGGALLVYRPWTDFDFGCGDVYTGPTGPCPVEIPVDMGDTRVVLTFNPVESYLMVQGLNVAKVHVWNGAQLIGDGPPLFFKVDTQKPNPPSNLHVTGLPESGWTASGSVDLNWVNTAETFPTETKSGLVSARYDVQPTTPGQADPLPEKREGVGISSLEDIELPADGKWRISVWTEDGAHNQSQRSDVYVNRDTVAPGGRIEAIDPERPMLIAATADDAGSGVAAAWLEYARAGSDQWSAFGDVATPQPGSSEPLRLVSRFPEARLKLPPGSYDLRLVVVDVAGNRTVVDQWGAGGKATVRSPMRDLPVVGAKLQALSKGKRKGPAAKRVVVPYGTAAEVSGTFADGTGAPIAGATLYLLETEDAVVEDAKAVTDSKGRFSVRVPPGATRAIFVRFRGSEKHAPAFTKLSLVSHGRIDLARPPRSVRAGRSFRLAGRVFNAGQPITTPKTVVIQVLAGRQWRTLFDFKVSGNGSFAKSWTVNKPGLVLRLRAFSPAEEAWWPFHAAKSRDYTIQIRR